MEIDIVNDIPTEGGANAVPPAPTVAARTALRGLGSRVSRRRRNDQQLQEIVDTLAALSARLDALERQTQLQTSDALLHTQMIDELATRIGDNHGSVDLHQRMIEELSTRIGNTHGSVDLHQRMIEELATRINQTNGSFENHQRMIDELATRIGDTHGSLENHQRMIDELATRIGDTHGSVDLHQRMIEELSTRLTQTNSQVELIDSEMVARPYSSKSTDGNGSRLLSFARDVSADEAYADFEDLFRGDETFIEERLCPYVAMVKDADLVIDIGCGRGEFLSLLQKAGVSAYGVDLDAEMLARAQRRGLDVRREDGLAHLQTLATDSAGAIVSFQVVEHLQVDQLRALMKEAQRVLRPGGQFIAETVNPHSPAALKTFWLDLTHVRPLFPESLLLLARELGFASGSIHFPWGNGDQELDLRQCGEYALLASK